MNKNRRIRGKVVLALTLVFILTVSLFSNVLAFSVNLAPEGNIAIAPTSVVPGSSFADFTQPDQLQRQSLIPDLLIMWDGTPVTTPEQWEERRQEIGKLLEFYFYGPVRITPNYVKYSSHTITPGMGGAQNINITVVGGPDAQNFATGVSTTGVTATTGNIAITLPSGTAPPGGWPLILGAPHNAAFWHARGFATAGQPTARGAHDALFGPRLNTVWYRNTGSYGIAAWMTQMLINGLRAEAEDLNRLNINPDRVAVSGASTNGKRAAAIGAMAECVWLSIPGAGGTGAANMYRQNSGNTTWNMFSSPSTLAGAPGTFPGAATGGMWGPIGLAESWGGHAGWDGNYGGHYRNIPGLNADFAPIDIHFVAAMYARVDGGKFFMPATGIAMEMTNGVPGIQQMIDHALPAFTLAGVPHNLGARVTRAAHGVDFEATAVILATINYVEGRHTPNNGYPDMSRYFTGWTGESPFSQAVQDYIYGLNFNIAHMHITPFASPENVETWARIQPCCNGDCDPCECPEWCPHTADGLCCDPGVPPIDPTIEVKCILIDFGDLDDPVRMGSPRQSLGWNQGPNVGVVNAEGFLERRFTNHGGGIIFNLPLGDAKLGNFNQLEVALRVTAASGANPDSPVGVVFAQDRSGFPGSGNWWDGNNNQAVMMQRPFAGLNTIGIYTFDLTAPFLGENGFALPPDQRSLTNNARWMTNDVSVAIGRNNHTSTMEFGYVWLRAIGCVCYVCTDWHDVYFEVAEGEGTLTATVDGEAIESGDRAIEGYEITFTAEPATSPVRYMVAQWRINGEIYEVDDEVFTGNVLVHELTGNVNIEVYFVLCDIESYEWSFDSEQDGTVTHNINSLGNTTINISLDDSSAAVERAYVQWFARIEGAAHVSGVPIPSSLVPIDLAQARSASGFDATLQLVDEWGVIPRLPAGAAAMAANPYTSEIWQYFVEVTYVLATAASEAPLASVRSATDDVFNEIDIRWDGAGFVRNRPIRNYFPWVHNENLMDQMPLETVLIDPFTFFAPAGQPARRVSTAADWEERRQQILDLSMYYLYGYLHNTPVENVMVNTGVLTRGNTAAQTINATVRDNGRVVTGNFGTGIWLPSDEQVAASPFNWEEGIPVIIGNPPVNMRNAMLDLGMAVSGVPSGNNRTGMYFTLFPNNTNITEFNSGSGMGNAWNVGRLLDAFDIMLERDGWGINSGMSVLYTGISIGGKQAMLMGSFNDRIALTVAGESGAVGLANFRFDAEGRIPFHNLDVYNRVWNRQERPAQVGRWNEPSNDWGGNNAHLFGYGTFQFFSRNNPGQHGINANAVREDTIYRLPIDQHLIVALNAAFNPALDGLNGFLGINNHEDNEWMGSVSQAISVEAVREVYHFLGYEDRIAMRMRDNTHSLQQRDWPFVIAAAMHLFAPAPNGYVTVPYIPTTAGPPAYGAGTFPGGIAALQSHPFEIDTSWMPWGNPNGYVLYTPNELVVSGIPTTIRAYTTAPLVTLTIWSSGTLNRYISPTVLATHTVSTVEGVAIFNLNADEVLIGRYELSIPGGSSAAQNTRSAFFNGIDARSALRTGATRHTVDNYVMFGFASQVNRDVRLYTTPPGGGSESNLLTSTVEGRADGWVFRYGAGPRVAGNTASETQFQAFIMRGLQLEAMPDYTFEVSFDSTFVHDGHWGSYSPTPLSWAASAEVQNIGPFPHWPPRGALFTNGAGTPALGGHRPAWREEHWPMDENGMRPVRTNETNTHFDQHFDFNVELEHNIIVSDVGVEQWIIDFSEPVHTIDFGIGFNFSDNFTLNWNAEGTQLTINFQDFRVPAHNQDLSMYIIRLRDLDPTATYQYARSTQFGGGVQTIVAGNQIPGPIHYSFPWGFGLNLFNNGPGGSPSTPNASLAASGIIRMWTQLMGVNAPISRAAIATMEATDQAGNCALHLFLVRPISGDIFTSIDVNKNAPWQYINFSITAYGQTVELLLVNALFEEPELPVFSLDIFNNGPVELGATPSRPNASLAASGTIRMWTQLDGVNARVPFEDLTVSAVLSNGDCAMEFITVNRIWNDLGWTPSIDANKNLPWERIYLTVSLLDQVVEVVLVNSNYEPATEYNTVTFILEPGAFESYVAPGLAITLEVPNGEAIPVESIPNVEARAGFYFAGWSPSDPSEFGAVTEDVTFTAQFNLLFHYVTFESGEGGELLPSDFGLVIRIRDGFTFWEDRAPTPVADEGFEFVGWFPFDPAGFVVRESITFTALFEPIVIIPPEPQIVGVTPSPIIVERDGTVEIVITTQGMPEGAWAELNVAWHAGLSVVGGPRFIIEDNQATIVVAADANALLGQGGFSIVLRAEGDWGIPFIIDSYAIIIQVV